MLSGHKMFPYCYKSKYIYYSHVKEPLFLLKLKMQLATLSKKRYGTKLIYLV